MEKCLTLTGRGCPNNCTFCTAHSVYGYRSRKRSVKNVIEDVKKAKPRQMIYILDESMSWDMEYAKEFLKAIIPLKIRWSGQANVCSFEDTEFCELMRRSGCMELDVGFESIRQLTIDKMGKGKTNRVDRYPYVIKTIQELGIVLAAEFILGFDEDDITVFDELVDFIEKNKILVPSINILTPFPGTPIFKKLNREGRILTKDWSKYSYQTGEVIYQPAQISQEELVAGYESICKRLFNHKSIWRRCHPGRKIGFKTSAVAMTMNYIEKSNLKHLKILD
jgi:radical SAM superfamily enzyme YgiQ (UPF0313 family)